MVKPEGLLLFHGAGGNKDHRLFVALSERLEIPVRRVNFAYRELGPRRPPPRGDKLIPEVVEHTEAFAADLGVKTNRLVLGGRSMGGRVASLAVADGLGARGLVLLSYPLHPPGKPDKLRVDHFPDITRPALFVSGDRDPFGTPEEFEHHLPSVGAATDAVWLPGDGHDPKKNDEDLLAAVERWLRRLR